MWSFCCFIFEIMVCERLSPEQRCLPYAEKAPVWGKNAGILLIVCAVDCGRGISVKI